MLIIPLYDLCAVDTELAALLSDGVGLKVGEFDAINTNSAPYVCWQIISADPEQYLSGVSDMDALYVQIDIYAKDKGTTRKIAKLVRKVIEENCSIEDFTGCELEPEVNLYRIRIESRWLEEP